MKRAHKLILLAAATSPVIVIAASCGFPDPSFRPDSDGSTVDGPGDGAAGDSPTGDSAPPIGANEDVDLEGGSKDATAAGEAALPIDAAGCMTCDCDTDTYDRKEGACDGGGSPNKVDCDDNIKAIHPQMTELFLTDVWPSGSKHTIVGDWDCSGATTKQYDYNQGECGTLALGCAKEGFVGGDPGCGGRAEYVKCEVDGLGCKSTKTQRFQGCH